MGFQTGKYSHRGFTEEIPPALLVFLPLQMFKKKKKLRLQIFNQLSGSPRVIRGQTKSQRVGLLHMTWREIRNDISPQSSRLLAVLSSADWLVCFAYFNPVQDSHNLPRGGSSSTDKRYSLLAPSFLWTMCFRTTRLVLTASMCICARMQFFRVSLHDLQSYVKKVMLICFSYRKVDVARTHGWKAGFECNFVTIVIVWGCLRPKRPPKKTPKTKIH